MSKRSNLAFAVVAATGLFAATTSAQDKKSVLLRTATSLAYVAPNGAAAVTKNTGAGVMDAKPAFRRLPNSNGFRIGTLFTVESPTANDAGSHMQGALTISDLTETGLTHRGTVMLPKLDGERAFMRPLIDYGRQLTFTLLVAASEDNGATNNPQAVAYVADLNGGLLPIENSTRGAGNVQKPTNLIQLSGAQDDQQYGPHSICSLGTDGSGESFLLGMQRNNANAYVMKVKVEPTATGAKVTVPFMKKVVDNARHCRPQITCPQPGIPYAYLTTVEANNQPAEVGVKVVAINPVTGDALGAKVIAESDPDGTKFGQGSLYAVQNSGLVHLGNGLAAVGYQVSSNQKRDNGNGHGGGANMSVLATLRISDMSVIDRATGVAPYQRHAFSFPMTFGPGAGKPAVAVMGGSSTGTGKGLIQIVEVDAVGKPVVATDAKLEVSRFSDVANLPARGKRNPNDQGAGFLNGIGGIENPGYGKPQGFLPEVRTFFLSALPGYAKDPQQAPETNRESLWISLVPATWDEKVNAVPGPVTEASDPGMRGPQPTATPPLPGSDAGPGPVPGTTGLPVLPSGETNTGCACSTTGRETSGNAAALLGVALALFAGRARRTVRRKS